MSDSPVAVFMSRPNLLDLPQFPLCEGFRFRMFQPGDHNAWIDVMASSGLQPTREAAEKQWKSEFETRVEEFCGRCVLIEDPVGKVVAISTAWYESPTSSRGRLHWVGVDPSCQGKGIGKALVAESFRVMATMHDSAMLQTESHRLPAIRIYLDFGFIPEIRGEEDKAAWIEIGRKLDAKN